MIRVSFAIITAGNEDARINEIIDSIERNGIPEYEVLVVGGMSTTLNRDHTRHIPFDEMARPGWITRKKNLATQEAQHDVIVYLHDYHVFDPDWYDGLVQFGTEWDILMNRVLTIEGHRIYDWVTWDHPTIPPYTYVPYSRTDLVPFQYFSGGFWISKRRVLLEEPLNENLLWGRAEDVEWSLRVRRKYRVTVNPKCIVRHNKIHRETSKCMDREARSRLYFPDDCN